MPTRTPSLPEVHDALRERILRDCHVAFPARVESYDASKQTVDVKPLLAEVYAEDDDSVTQVQPAVISAVPVLFPGGGGYRLTCPIQVGDTVLCVVADRSIDLWSEYGGPQAPADLRRHNRTDAIAIPGLHASAAPWTGASTDHLTLGRDGGPQVHCKAATIELGTATDKLIKGDTFFTGLSTFLTACAAFGTLNPTTGGAAFNAAATALQSALTSYLSTMSKTQ